MKRNIKIKRVNITLNYISYQKLFDLAFSNYITPTTMAKQLLTRSIENEYKDENRKENIPGARQMDLFKKTKKGRK